MMLSTAQVQHFEEEGYLVVPDVLPADLMARIRAEYAHLMDHLYADWFAQPQKRWYPD